MQEILKITKETEGKLMQFFTRVYVDDQFGRSRLREMLYERDLQYYRENDWTEAHRRAQIANRRGQSTRLQNVQVPIVQPQVESQLADLTSIFLTGYPIFGVIAKPDAQDQAAAMEAVITDNAAHFGWVRNLMLGMRDGLKYNVMGVDVDWQESYVGSVINDLGEDGELTASTKRLDYAGNRIHRMDLYNTVFDTTVHPGNMHVDGEFCGYSTLVNRTRLKRDMQNFQRGTLINATAAFESGVANVGNAYGTAEYYIPEISGRQLIDAQMHQQNWLTWLGIAETKIQYSPSYEKTVLYARLIPKEFKMNLSQPGTPRIFKLIVINRRQIIYCQPMTNAHDYLPTIIGQPDEDGLGWQAKSYADQLEPYQEISTALWTSVIEGQRRAVYDRLLYDPDRVRASDINRADSVGRVPVRGKQYSRNVGEAVMQLPYRMENQGSAMQLIGAIGQYADEAGGSNKAARGQFQKGNKTRYEYEDTMGGSSSRTRTRALMMEAQMFTPIKTIVKLNTLQYQTSTQVPDQRSGEIREVDPIALRKNIVNFKLSDGLMPTSKMISGDLLDKIAQLGMAVPAIGAEYDIMGMLEYNWRLNGAMWLPDFKRKPKEKQQYIQDTQQLNPRAGGNPSQPQGVSNGPAATK